MTFKQRAIDVEIELGTGPYGDGAGVRQLLKDRRVQCAVSVNGGASQGVMQLRVFGMTLDEMNRFTTIGALTGDVRRNVVRVSAGELGKSLSLVFEGIITYAAADMRSQPDVAFNIIAFSAGLATSVKAEPLSWAGAVDAARMIQTIAALNGMTFENSGVDKQLTDQNVSGSPYQQMLTIANAADAHLSVEFGVVAIWPRAPGFYRQRPNIPIVSPATGMANYPTFSSNSVIVTTEYNPQIILGSRIDLRSDLKAASGIMQVFAVSHEIDAEIPDGNWWTQIQCRPMPRA